MEVDWEVTQTIVPSSLTPAISPGVELSLTIVYTSLYGLLFVLVYIQLWMILYYRHKRVSHQSVFLFLCLLWAGLRTTLFSFYFNNCILANNLDVVPYWLLYCCPVCLQFITLCLLVLFFAQVVYKSRSKYEPNKYRTPLRVGIVIAILIFIATNMTCAVIVQNDIAHSENSPEIITVSRVVINDTLFIFCGSMLSYFIYRMSKMTSANMMLEAKGTSKCQALVTCAVIVILYSSRAIYNLIAVASPRHIIDFGFGWINVSDQADFIDLTEGFAYVSFGIVLFVWEFLPTFTVVIFFRVQRPINSEEQKTLSRLSQSSSSRAYFFDNPRRYDSDDDVSVSRSYGSRASNMFDSPGPYVISDGTGSVPLHYGSSSFASSPLPPFLQQAASLPPIMQHETPPPSHVFYDGT